MGTERRLAFVGWETSTVDACGNGEESYVIDLDDCGYVIDGDDWHDDAVISELARDHGVPVAELWAAYKREQQRENGNQYGNTWACQYCGDEWNRAGQSNLCAECSAIAESVS